MLRDQMETSKAEADDSVGGEADSAEAASEESSDEKSSINTADSRTLQPLSGIGESRAQVVIDYREQCGDFEGWGDVEEVPKACRSGTGESTRK